MTVTLIRPVGYSSSTCGYCSPSGERSTDKTSISFGVLIPQMSPQVYQHLIDRGWRRSGDYTYHPDMARTCCPQYTIRLDVSAFKPTKHHRGVVNRFNRFISTGQKPGESAGAGGAADSAGQDGGMVVDKQVSKGNPNTTTKSTDKGDGKASKAGKSGNGQAGDGKGGKQNGKPKPKNVPFNLYTALREHQVGYGEDEREDAHRFELELTPADATPETFALYKRYQIAVHKDKPSKVTMSGFSRFLCRSPVRDSKIKYARGADTTHLPKTYGSYHLLYRVDGELIGISVIDILPKCVSSVYFIWDPEWAWAALGKLSALYETALARDMMVAGAEGMGFLYMGYWIATCPKMRYKGEYSPSYLLDPGTHEFHPLTPKLDKYLQAHGGYTPFAEIESNEGSEAVSQQPAKAEAMDTDDEGGDSNDSGDESEEDDDDLPYPNPPPPGMLPLSAITQDVLDDLIVYSSGARQPGVVPYAFYKTLIIPRFLTLISETVAAVGPDVFASLSNEDYRGKALLYFG